MQKGLKITRWGNGQGIRIPLAVMKLLSLKTGDSLDMEITENELVLKPARKKLTLADRFADYDGVLITEEIWPDENVGREVF